MAIIGAGLVGVTAVLYLKPLRPARRIVVLERSALPSGASTKNASFACFGSISALLEQEKRGDLPAVVAACWAGLARLRELVGDGPLDYQPVGGYELFRHEEAAPANECRDKSAILMRCWPRWWAGSAPFAIPALGAGTGGRAATKLAAG